MMTKRSPRWRKFAVAFGVSFGTLLVLAAGVVGFVRLRFADRIAPNVFVASVPVGGLTAAAATDAVQTAVDAVGSDPIVLEGEGVRQELPLEALAPIYDVEATVHNALARGRSSNLLTTVYQQLSLLTGEPARLSVVVTFDAEPVTTALEQLNRQLGEPAKPARIDYRKGKLVATDEHAGTTIQHSPVVTALRERLASLSSDRTLSFALTADVPVVRRTDVERLLPSLESLVAAPVTLTFPKQTAESITVDTDELTNWFTVERATSASDAGSDGDRVGPSSSQRQVFAQVPAVDARGGFIQAVVNQATLDAYLKTLAQQVDQRPTDAKLTITDGRVSVFATSQSGRELDQATALTRISEALLARAKATVPTAALGEKAVAPPTSPPPLSVELPVTVVTPTVTSDSVTTLGLNQLIGRGETDFAGSPENRIHNLTLGTKYLTGRLVKPGEEFSTVAALGAVEASTGYLPELVIKENKTIPEYGGGLCQVSTTLFRAVMNAGLPITARQNHSYRVSYYERGVGPGLDATVYLPKPDFKFKNDTPGWILIQGSVSGKKLTFELYGTSDGRTSEIIGPTTLTTQDPGPDIVTVDESLAPGTKQELQKRHVGATTTATYAVRRDGVELNRQTFLSKYKAIAAEYRVGPAAPAEPPPEPAPATEATP